MEAQIYGQYLPKFVSHISIMQYPFLFLFGCRIKCILLAACVKVDSVVTLAIG